MPKIKEFYRFSWLNLFRSSFKADSKNKSGNEAPRSKLRGIKAELRRSRTVYALRTSAATPQFILQQAAGYYGEGESTAPNYLQSVTNATMIHFLNHEQ